MNIKEIGVQPDGYLDRSVYADLVEVMTAMKPEDFINIVNASLKARCEEGGTFFSQESRGSRDDSVGSLVGQFYLPETDEDPRRLISMSARISDAPKLV